MHVIAEAPTRPPNASTRRRAALFFLKSLDLAASLRAYHDCGRVDSGHWSAARTSLDGQIEFTRPEGARQDSSPRTPELRSRFASERSEKFQGSGRRIPQLNDVKVVPHALALYGRQEFVRRKWPTGESDGSGKGGLSIQVLCYSPCSDSRVNHLEKKRRRDAKRLKARHLAAPFTT
ncbi:hypothetical protein CSAL01_11889 [Colletotrichum salicis]|uniref:Uncharacterized protein n=1 Tax=Colletotrichum salicis TaxID=1209931 RepID=A0A135TS43_9PEZI|nr:hypothetical protein CSAL01_11889 [Colletotrichum salicis]